MNENKIEVFSSAEFGAVRTLKTEDGKVLFCGKDVAVSLGYTNPLKAIRDHCKEEGVNEMVTPTAGGIQKMKFITEGNVYRLITHSKLPNAERFEAWVFDEVLPTIRKHGAYTTAAPDYSALSPQLQFMIQMEQRQNRLETAVEDTNRRLDSMCEAMQVRGTNWRKATYKLVNCIASASQTDTRTVYLDIYDEIEYRAGVNLNIRLDNMIDRMRERGISKSTIDRLNKIDVIAEDKKLIEIYIAVVKELAVKYKAF